MVLVVLSFNHCIVFYGLVSYCRLIIVNNQQDSSNESDEGEQSQEGDVDQSPLPESEDINDGCKDENEGKGRNGEMVARTKKNIKTSVDNESEDSDEEVV